MMDLMYLLIVTVFFALTFGLMRMCDYLAQHKTEERS